MTTLMLVWQIKTVNKLDLQVPSPVCELPIPQIKRTLPQSKKLYSPWIKAFMQTDPRLNQLNQWLVDTLGDNDYSLTAVSGDASFRRYFRYQSKQRTLIAVDAPPEKENNDAFMLITHLLEAEGIAVPHIHYSSLDFGYFLLDDFGNTLLLDILNQSNVNDLYSKAIAALHAIQNTPPSELPEYDEELLHNEMELFRQWYLRQHLGIDLSSQHNKIIDRVFDALKNNALEQPKVFVHRDFHSRNLMMIDDNNLGVIDYQDAVVGPITYDLVSLLRDCYIQWPNEKVQSWVKDFYQQLNDNNRLDHVEFKKFLKWFDLMGIQRHLKAIGIFSRLNIRDQKPAYLNDIPRTMGYIHQLAPEYNETKELLPLLETIVPKISS